MKPDSLSEQPSRTETASLWDETPSQKPFLFALLLFSLACRLILIQFKDVVGTDEVIYLALGKNLWHGLGFRLHGSPDHHVSAFAPHRGRLLLPVHRESGVGNEFHLRSVRRGHGCPLFLPGPADLRRPGCALGLFLPRLLSRPPSLLLLGIHDRAALHLSARYGSAVSSQGTHRRQGHRLLLCRDSSGLRVPHTLGGPSVLSCPVLLRGPHLCEESAVCSRRKPCEICF